MTDERNPALALYLEICEVIDRGIRIGREQRANDETFTELHLQIADLLDKYDVGNVPRYSPHAIGTSHTSRLLDAMRHNGNKHLV